MSLTGTNWVFLILALVLGALALYSSLQGTCPWSQAVESPATAAATPPVLAEEIARLVYADQSNFEQWVLRSQEPVLVDFYADWCGPCQRLSPILDRVAEQLTSGRIVKVNVDDSPGLAAQYRVQSIPTMVLFVGGQEVQRLKGIRSEAELADLFTTRR
ncbi:MAG: thioredoxin [Thermoguttaceae bacterium]|jgi:thioredoxin 1